MNPRSEPYVHLLSDQDAWSALPATEGAPSGRLPAWARALAASLPLTTAATLTLDRIFRTSTSIDPGLAAAIRLVVAQTVGSDWLRSEAAFDLEASGWDRSEVARIEQGSEAESGPNQRVLRFAARLTTAGRDVTDDEVARLVEEHGEAGVVAIVLQVAFANFLGRLAQSLGLAAEVDGPVGPISIPFLKPASSVIPPASRPVEPTVPILPPRDRRRPDLDFPQVQERLEAQRERSARVSIPTWDEFRAALPETLYPRSETLKIRWSLLVSGRQPVLGPAWIDCLRTFEGEAHQDRVFEESLFWVVTQSLNCFYCMGHCEMLLGVAGLDHEAIADRTARLGGADWSSFTPAEQIAFSFARKLTQTPQAMTAADVHQLQAAFGPVRALDVVWWSSRCQFMTKVSDAFQIPLERDNVFRDHLVATPDPLPAQS